MESYEKKYKEALEVAKRKLCFDKAGMVDSFTPNDIYEIFPELKESEDEKIRKEILDCFRAMKQQGCFPSKHKEQYDSWIAWLEKQKEFVSADFDDVWETADCDELTAPLEKYSKDAIKKMCHAWYDKGIELERRNWLEKQGEQKSIEWSGKIDTKHAEGKLKEMLDRKEGHAWSEEDKKEIKRIIGLLEGWLSTFKETCYAEDCKCGIVWLKSLKERYTWKPSDAQMEILSNEVTAWKKGCSKQIVLESLYNDLKKL